MEQVFKRLETDFKSQPDREDTLPKDGEVCEISPAASEVPWSPSSNAVLARRCFFYTYLYFCFIPNTFPEDSNSEQDAAVDINISQSVEADLTNIASASNSIATPSVTKSCETCCSSSNADVPKGSSCS
jgi:hypothetical protein